MTRVLIAGLKEPPGGVENVVLSYVQHFDHQKIHCDFAFISNTVSFESKITEFGGKVYYLPNRVRHPFEYRKQLKLIFEQNLYDAVWCNFSGLTNIDFLKLAKKHHIDKRIAHAHTANYSWGNILMKYLVPIFHLKNRAVISNYANILWACSEKSADFMFGKKLVHSTEIVPNAISTQNFKSNPEMRKKIRSEFGIGSEDTVVGHVGRMCTEKNQCFMLDVMKKVIEKKAISKLLFVGDGELHNEIINYCESIGISDSVIFTGSRNDVADIMQAFDVFLLPSLTEGFPVTILEAQAANLPCVTSKEAVTSTANITGNVIFLSLKDNTELWAQQILSCADLQCNDGIESLTNAGFDIVSQAEKIQSYLTGEN
ncbi:MAG: glycosyltransferase [Clostridia bacterium]|nr:glycosyltransferase [Clostridia bacterium]